MTPVVILAGGRGARMGGDKPFYPYRGVSLIETVLNRLKPQADLVCVNVGRKDHPLRARLSGLGLPVVTDAMPGLGPLSGVHASLRLAQERGWPQVITAPCDMPDLPADYVTRLLEAPAADVAFYAGSRDHPLCALWQTRLVSRLEDALQAAVPQGGLAVRHFLSGIQCHRVQTQDERAFGNINHADDLPDEIGPDTSC